MEPVDTLPSEILAQIFKSGTTLPSTRPGCLPCLVAYSSVSQRWRSAALEHPDLWTAIHVPFSMRNVVAWIALCLERSKSCLFDITLRLPEPMDMSVITNVMLLVVQHVSRLRCLVITADSFLSNPGEIFALLQNAQRARRLAVLELTFPDPNSNISMTIPHGGLLIHTPSLTSLRLHGVASPVPFVGLRSLDIQGLRTTHADFRDMVTASPLLTALILPKLRLMVDLKSKSLPPIEIPSLKILALSFSKPLPSNQFNPCHNLISLLSIPNLEYLELVGGMIPDLAKTFQDPSAFTKLRTLRLVGVAVVSRNPDVNNVLYLRALTTIEELQLIHSHAEYLLPTETISEKRPKVRSSRTRSISSRDDGARRMYYPHARPHQSPATVNPRDSPSSSEPIYPNLRSISLDTLPAVGALWLYRFVMETPQIEFVKLSPGAEKHLSTSLGMRADGTLQTLPFTPFLDPTENNPVDAGKLLRKRVRVQEIDTDGYIHWQSAVI
ncbi:hypothetical protein GGX14DRAFT_494442 [Mycena pura]|uniref:F-box domain-containing protein n=1 Tax=Mycena pura TaxID=153505 RepID=A0AAD6YJM8_9AGAR|nr:hypothetical protein GGX14DRAFT_494442 [Mycena pura]